jgi:alcohol dehydrogenase
MVDSIQGLRPDGRLVTIGAAAEPLSISLMDLITRPSVSLGASKTAPNTFTKPLISSCKEKLRRIVETYPLAESRKAYQRVAEGKTRFRAVLTM